MPADAARAIEPHRRTAADVIAELGSDERHGLSGTEARARLERFGRNELEAEQPVPAWRRFLAQFQDVLVVLLLVATAISAALWYVERDAALPYEALAILAVVLLNAALGYLQESRAEAAVAALRAMSADEAAVVRDGEQRRIPAAELVPGDIVLIEEGDRVPADARIIASTSLRASEAALTGESLPVWKDTAPIDENVAIGDRHNMLWAGTAAAYGRGRAVVTATGMRTEMGRIAGLLAETEDEATPLQRELDRTGKLLGGVVVAIAAVMIGTILLVRDIADVSALFDVLILGVALAVAAVPEGLPAVVTAVLSLGVQRMARRNAIVRHLAAVETLGSASVIASDKTGTLTRNEMTVRVVATASGRVRFGGTGYAPEGEVAREGGGELEAPLRAELERALTAADLANNARVEHREGRWTVQGDPTEAALIVAARKAGLDEQRLDERLPRIGEVPFSSERKLMSTLHRDAANGERVLVFAKGAADVLLARCTHEVVGGDIRPLTDERRTAIEQINEQLAGEALRTLGVAVRTLPAAPAPVEHADAAEPGEAPDGAADVEHDLAFAGLIGMIDPPRDEAAESVARAKSAGIRPIMITGDHPRTAAVIARELGISAEERAVAGPALETMSDDQLDRVVGETSVFARVDPEHKLRIVDALQRGGAIVAMTGDGVNDAPALKTADIGVAMGITGTDVSKEAADIVLADDDFATIVAAVEEGRAIFANIRKFLRYLLSSNIGEVMTMFFGVLLAGLLGLPSEGGAVVLPLLATQILWINLVTDGAPALALGVDPADPMLMREPPRPAGERVITGAMWRDIFIAGTIMALGTLLVLDAAFVGGLIPGAGDLRYGQTMAFTTLVLFQLFNVLNVHAGRRSLFENVFANRWLWAAIGLSLALQFVVLYVPFMQRAFGTTALSVIDWGKCAVPASTILWIGEARRFLARRRSRRQY